MYKKDFQIKSIFTLLIASFTFQYSYTSELTQCSKNNEHTLGLFNRYNIITQDENILSEVLPQYFIYRYDLKELLEKRLISSSMHDGIQRCIYLKTGLPQLELKENFNLKIGDDRSKQEEIIAKKYCSSSK